jgi:hypothetical protein
MLLLAAIASGAHASNPSSPSRPILISGGVADTPSYIVLGCSDESFAPCIDFFTDAEPVTLPPVRKLPRLGFLLRSIFPADDPEVATLSRDDGSLHMRLERRPRGRGDTSSGVVLRLPCFGTEEVQSAVAPNGAVIDFFPPQVEFSTPELVPAVVVSSSSDGPAINWVSGRAGMLYKVT